MDKGKTSTERLEQQGWTQRFTGIGPRLDEMVKLYEELGFEVHLESMDSHNLPAAACEECFLVQTGRFFILYTQPTTPHS